VNKPQLQPTRHISDLLIGRQSISDARYFLTFCEVRRRPGLVDPIVAQKLKHSLNRIHASGDLSLVAATVMPDHVHLLGILGQRLSLSRAIGKFKADTHRYLRSHGLEWQENYHDHRLRHENEYEPFARYIFLNPYRAGLIQLNDQWPSWWRWGDLRFEFEAMAAQTGGVPRAWLGDPDPEGAVDL
jgi:REP element-mobilizing transposase RayT